MSCVCNEFKKRKSYNKVSCNIHRRILKRMDYFTNFVTTHNISTVRRAARDLEVGMVRGGTKRRVMFTRSYRTVIVRSSYRHVAVLRAVFFTFPFET